jgi:SAM-dependent methyltransferase
MKEHHCRRILDFGAGALRHSLPLLRAGFEVTVVEYENAFKRPVAAKKRAAAKRFNHFAGLVWPHDFIRSKEKYDVVLLVFVLQTVPEKSERNRILYEIAKKLDPDGPRRIYYASRFGDKTEADKAHAYRDGWIRKLDNEHQTFYTEWSPAETESLMKKQKFERTSGYSGASQSYIFEHQPRKVL